MPFRNIKESLVSKALFVVFIIGCNQKVKPIEFEKLHRKQPDDFYLNYSTKKMSGRLKSNQVNKKVFLSYQVTLIFDTSANSKIDKSLFLGNPIFYGNYPENFERLVNQLKLEDKRRSDSLEKNVYRGKRRGLRNLTAEELLIDLSLHKASAEEINRKAILIFKEIEEAKRLNTYPFYYKDAHFKSRLPSFNARLILKFYDEDGFQIASYVTKTHYVVPFSDNKMEGTIELDYKKVQDYDKEIFSKTKKILVNIVGS